MHARPAEIEIPEPPLPVALRRSFRGNRATDNGTAIAITGGSCGARDNFMDASVLDNEVNSTLAALGGSNFSCPGSPLPATGNRNSAVIAGNRIAVLSPLPV